MSGNAELSDDGRTLAVRVPMTVARRGGRKVILAPDEAAIRLSRGQIDNALIKALARAFRWRKLIESGVYGTIAELAAAERLNPSYVSRMLRLTLLAPKVVESILEGRQMPRTLDELMRSIPERWCRQRPKEAFARRQTG
jgi:hypothetical protein